MNTINKLLALIAANPHCKVIAPNKDLIIERAIPNDLKLFYEITNGLSLFKNQPFGLRIVGKEEFMATNEFLYPKDDIIWEELKGDMTNHWFLIAKNEELEQYISIDLGKENFGKCYDSYLSTHGEEGMSDIVANSFTELLMNIYNSKGMGDTWYWNKSDFIKLGDAFD